MDKIYNKTIINVGSVGNSFVVIRNESKDIDAYVLSIALAKCLNIEYMLEAIDYEKCITNDRLELLDKVIIEKRS